MLWERDSYNGSTLAFPACHSLSGYRIMVIPQLSKLMLGVRFSLPAEAMAGRQAGGAGSIPVSRSISKVKSVFLKF